MKKKKLPTRGSGWEGAAFASLYLPIVFYGLYLCFWINEVFFRKKEWRAVLWAHMRLQLFVINGACQHSGNCCRSLMLIKEGHPVDTLERYEKLVEDDMIYSRFVPRTMPAGDPEKIVKFQCTCLTSDNRCNDYKNRPKICHQYPMSMFVKVGYIHAGCGYSVQLRGLYPYVKHPVFWALFFQAMRENRIGNQVLQGLRRVR